MRIAIISDIHEDIVRLQKAIDLIKTLDIDKIVCLGDIVGFEHGFYKYGETRSASKCVQIIHKYSHIIIAGNHDLFASERLPLFADQIGLPKNWYSISKDEKEHKYEHKFFLYQNEAENDLTSSERMMLDKLDSWNVVDTENTRILFSHFIFPDISGNMKTFQTNKDGFSRHFDWMEKLKVNISFVGHAHMNGIGIATQQGLKINKFGIYSLKDEPQVVLCPSIVEGKFKNGFVLFDSNNMSLEVKGF